MLKITSERGNASLASVFGIMAVVGLYVAQDQQKTHTLQAEVLTSTLSSLAKQANETALSRTKNLLQKNSSGQPGVNIQSNGFAAGAGSGFQIQQGKLLLNTPDPRSAQWMNASAAGSSSLTSRVSLEKVERDVHNQPVALIAVAETEVTAGEVTKTHRTRARFNLAALNPPTPPAAGSGSGSPPASGVASNPASGSLPTAVASQSPASGSGPCGTSMSPGNSTASSNTGPNSSNSSAQGQNTGSSAQTTNNSASGCAASQTGGSTAIATGGGTGGNVTTSNTASTTGNTANANSSTVARGTGAVSATSSATATVGGSGR